MDPNKYKFIMLVSMPFLAYPITQLCYLENEELECDGDMSSRLIVTWMKLQLYFMISFIGCFITFLYYKMLKNEYIFVGSSFMGRIIFLISIYYCITVLCVGVLVILGGLLLSFWCDDMTPRDYHKLAWFNLVINLCIIAFGYPMWDFFWS